MSRNFHLSLLSITMACSLLMLVAAPTSLTGADTYKNRLVKGKKHIEMGTSLSKKLDVPYFPLPVVASTLEKFGVPKEQRLSMLDDLGKVDELVFKMVSEKGSKMRPNPLEEPRDDEAATRLIQETSKMIFTKVANKNGITNKKQILAMLSEIQKEKALLFSKKVQNLSFMETSATS